MAKSLNWIIAALVLVAFNVSADAVTDAIAERIKPAGKVCVQGEDCGAVVVAATAAVASSEPRSGETIYNTACTACHSSGAAGAPIVGNVESWASHIAKGIDTLHTHAIKGFNGMPAMGLCMDCSEDDIKATVDYMVEQSQ